MIVVWPRTRFQQRLGLLTGHDVYHALYLAAWDGDPSRARQILEGVPERAPIRLNSLWNTAWAAIHRAEGNERRASQEAARALTRLRRFGLRSGADLAERGWIDSFTGRDSAQRVETAPGVILVSKNL